MNKLGLQLYKKSFFLKKSYKIAYLTKPINHTYASSKQQKQPIKPSTNNIKPSQKQLLKTTTILQKNQQQSQVNKQKTQQKGVMTEQQRKQLAFQQKLQATYLQLQSLPSDSYETVVQNFKRIKCKLMDRKVYVPNKPQLLAQLDKSMQLVKKHHTTWSAPSTAPPRRMSDSKSQIIEWELQQAKKKYMLSLFDDQRVLIAAAFSLIVFFGGMEYYWFVREQKVLPKVPKMNL